MIGGSPSSSCSARGSVPYVRPRAEGAQRGVPWAEAKLTLLLREMLAGEFCTAVIGCCGAAEADTQSTISTLHFLMQAGRLSTRVRLPQPPLEAQLRRLRSLDERLMLQQQRWLERKPPLTLVGAWASGGGARILPATGGAEDLGPQNECGWFRDLAAQLGVVAQQREEQMAQLRRLAEDLRATLSEAGRQRRSLPWQERRAARGGSGVEQVSRRLEVAEQLLRALGEWLREAFEAHASLVHAVRLRSPITA